MTTTTLPPGQQVLVTEFAEDPMAALERHLTLAEQPAPDPASLRPGEILLRIRSAAVAWVDLLMTSGQYQHMPQPPYTPGMEYSGDVLATAPDVDPARVADVAQRLDELGSYEVSLGDTIGVGTPGTVLRMLEAVAARVPVARLAGHYHDTYGMGVANVLASYQFGLRSFDSSIAGLGGCPYAKGATGNVATEDVVYLLHGLGAQTGIDLEQLVDCAAWISQQLERAPNSRVSRAMLAKRQG